MESKKHSYPTLKSLKVAIRECRICESNLPLGANPVIRAKASAKIIVAGQAPGLKVHQTSIPFNDPSGVRLRQWMGVTDAVFYDSSKIAIVPMGFCYPGRGKSGDLPPRKECAAHWHASVLEALPQVSLILAIGQFAQRYYLKDQRAATLTETVKNWRDYLPAVMPLPHPSPRNNIWLKRNSWFESEVLPTLRRLVQEKLDSKEISLAENKTN